MMVTASTNITTLTSSGYMMQSEKTIGNHRISRFIFNNEQEGVRAKDAASAIESLLKENPHLSFISRPDSNETLVEKVLKCRYLIINGNALCLTNKSKAPDDINIVCKDRFFSEALIDEPVQCQEKHIFEKKHIKAWVDLNGDNCPFEEEGSHKVGKIKIALLVLEEIQSYRNGYVERVNHDKKLVQERRELLEKIEINVEKIKLQDMRIISLTKKHNRTVEIACDTGKVVMKGIAVAHSSIKKVPVIGVIAGVIFACYRAYHGESREEYIKAVGELISGGAGMIPGIGMAVGIGIDGLMGAHDVYETTQFKIDVKLAHELIGLDPKKTASKEEIDTAYRGTSPDSHSDLVNKYGDKYARMFDDVQAVVNKCKEILYRHYKFI